MAVVWGDVGGLVDMILWTPGRNMDPREKYGGFFFDREIVLEVTVNGGCDVIVRRGCGCGGR